MFPALFFVCDGRPRKSTRPRKIRENENVIASKRQMTSVSSSEDSGYDEVPASNYEEPASSDEDDDH